MFIPCHLFRNILKIHHLVDVWVGGVWGVDRVWVLKGIVVVVVWAIASIGVVEVCWVSLWLSLSVPLDESMVETIVESVVESIGQWSGVGQWSSDGLDNWLGVDNWLGDNWCSVTGWVVAVGVVEDLWVSLWLSLSLPLDESMVETISQWQAVGDWSSIGNVWDVSLEQILIGLGGKVLSLGQFNGKGVVWGHSSIVMMDQASGVAGIANVGHGTEQDLWVSLWLSGGQGEKGTDD